MKITKFSLAFAPLCLPLFYMPLISHAGAETVQYCNELYPADAYDPTDRQVYVRECIESYIGSDVSEAVEEPAPLTDDSSFEESSVDEYIQE
jgi:hypothetical protein